MKRLFTLGLFSLLMMLSISASSQSLYYDFKDTLGERDGNGPSLNQLGTGSFVSDTLNELSCLPRRVYTFGNNDGLQFDNSAAGTFLGETYSIEMYFKWLDNGGFKRIIDFKNRTEDFGLYATTSVLSFYDGLDVNTNQFVANQYVYLCITRDSASQLVSMYVDGVLVGDFTDINERGVIDTSQVLNFFRDDLIFGGEARPGNIAFLKLHNFELTANQVDDSYNSIKDTMHILTFTQDITSSCLTGNLVNFTNTSENDSSQVSYLWDFGDGNSAAGTNASYSYSAGGVFNVALIGSASGGCTDTAFSSVEIFALPAIDLGADVSACQGDQVVLDAGGSFATYQWSTAATSQTIIVGTSGTYYATVTDNNGCVNSDSVTVVFNALPVVTLPGDSTICDGQTLTLSGPPSMSSYNWSTGETTQDIVVSVSGVYAVAVVDLNGCGASDTVTISVNALPVVSLGADTSICDGTTLTLDAGAGFSGYLWSDNSAGQTLDVTVSGTYSVTVTDGFGCQGTDAVDVIVNPAPIVDLGVDFTMCGGTLTTLDAGAGQSAYLWNDGSQNQTLDIITGGTFSVTVTDANGCTASDVVTITVNPALNLGPEVVVCDGQAVTLDAGAGLSAYVWNTGEVTQTILVSASGVYGVAITDINGCINSDSLTVTFSTAPVVDLGPDVTACNGTVVSLDAGSGFTNYTWNDGSSLQTLDVSTSGTYYVTVSNIDGCTATDSVTVTILAPVVVTLGNDTTVCDGELVTLDAGAGYTAYLWNDGSSAQTLTASSAGTYEVTVTDANGCTASDVVVINFFAPVPVPTVTQINSNTIESSPAAGYQWYQVPGGPIVGATSQTYSPPQNGTFYVVVTDANGCQSEPSSDFDFINTGISDITSGWAVYPNPADQTLFITITGISGAAVQAEIIDLAGRTVLAQQFGAGDKGEMDISSLASGTYMVKLMHQGAVLVKPVVVR